MNYESAPHLTEQQQITRIGSRAMELKGKVGFIVNTRADAERYIKTLLLEYPELIVGGPILPFEDGFLGSIKHKTCLK